MVVELDQTLFHLFEDGVEDEPGSLFANLTPEEPEEADFMNACTVANYYARNISKVLSGLTPMNVEICNGKSARKLIGLSESGGGYVVVCKELDPYTFDCRLVYYEANEL